MIAKTAFTVLNAAGCAVPTYRSQGFGGRTAGDLIGMIEAGSIDLTRDHQAENIAVVLVGTNGYDHPGLTRLVEVVKALEFSVVVLTTPPRRGPNPTSGAGGPGSNQAYDQELRTT